MATAQELQKNTETNNIANYGVNTLGQAPNIPIAQIIPTQPLKLGNQQPDNSASLLGTTNSSINYVNDLTTQSNNALAQVNTSQNDITGLMTRILGKTADTQAANESSGLNAATKQLSELNAQAQSLNREAQAIPIQVQQNALPGSTRGGNAPVNADMLRTNALKALSLAQQADIATANYTAAKDKAQQIIDLKYLPLEQELAIKRQQYEFNKDILTRVDAKRAEALQVALKKQEQDLAEKKAQDKTIQEMFVEADANLVPPAIRQQASDLALKGGTPAQISALLGKYGGAASRAELLREQIKTEKAQRENIYSQINARKAEAKDKLLSIDEATKLGVPYGTTQSQAIALGKSQEGKPMPLNAVQKNALASAQSLLKSLNNDFGGLLQTSAPIGINSLGGTIPGTKRRDFSINFDNLKSLLSLDNVKLLKGQGAVSDAERQLLADASTKLNRNQSPEEFKKTLTDIITTLNKASPEYQYIDSIEGAINNDNSLDPNSYWNSLITQ